MHDTRHAVIALIRTQRQATVASLAEALDVSPITIRHHLAMLQGEGLINVVAERHHVGRPKHIYTLTEAAQRYFPNQYHVLTERLLDELKARLPADQVALIIDSLAAGVAARYNIGRVDGTLEDRLHNLVEVLGTEGFMAEIKRVDGALVLTEMNCPYMYIGQRHPEVCRIDRTLIEEMLDDVEVEQTSCILHGAPSCVFNLKEKAVG